MEYLGLDGLVAGAVDFLDGLPAEVRDGGGEEVDEVRAQGEVGVLDWEGELDFPAEFFDVLADGDVEGAGLLDALDVLVVEGAVCVAGQVAVIIIDALDSGIDVLDRLLEQVDVLFERLGVLAGGVVAHHVLHVQEFLKKGLGVEVDHGDAAVVVGVQAQAGHLWADEGRVAGRVIAPERELDVVERALGLLRQRLQNSSVSVFVPENHNNVCTECRPRRVFNTPLPKYPIPAQTWAPHNT